jgi:peptide/nickel transport system ATP-binding protein
VAEPEVPIPVLEVRNLTKQFAHGRTLFATPTVIHAVNDVSFAIEAGEIFALVGESGSGKSTTGRCILRLIEPTSGSIFFRGEDVTTCSPRRMRALRRDMQIIFQDPHSSLNPRMRVRDIVEEPLLIHNVGSRDERQARVEELLRIVGLEAMHGARYPHEFSGGQRQRIAIARAIALSPAFVVADEAVSALDMSIQAQVVDLLVELKERLKLTFLFIAHDLRLVRDICRRVAVMYRGRIVEMGPTASVFAGPAHPYTRALLSAVPALDPDARHSPLELDPTSFDSQAPLRQVQAGHWAAT